MAFDYVKFRRGNADAFSALHPKDPNTLYFVYSNPAAKRGLLYLGNKLIGGGEFSQLIDVDVANAQPGDILWYTNIGTEENPIWGWQAIDPERLPLIPDDAILSEDSHLAPGDTLSQAIMKLDEAIAASDSNTWRAVRVNGVEALSNAITSGAVDFAGGDGIALSAENGTITISLGNNLIQVLQELFEEHPEILPVFDGEGPGLVPAAPEVEQGDSTSNYVLAGDGTWININNYGGPYWEELSGYVVGNYIGKLLDEAYHNDLEPNNINFTLQLDENVINPPETTEEITQEEYQYWRINGQIPEAGLYEEPQNIILIITRKMA